MNRIKYLLVGLMISVLSFSACNDDDDDDDSGPMIENNLLNGTWRVSLFFDDAEDKTPNFNGYNFTFSSNDTVTATNGILTFTGTWDIDEDDDNADDVTLNFSDSPFNELNEDWNILENTDTRVQLEHNSDFLTFEKN